MKKIILLAFVLISSSLTFAQDKKSLEERTAKMYEITINSNNDYSPVVEYTYPKLFTIVPKETLIQAMNTALNSPEFKVEMMDIEPNFSYGTIKKIDDAYYCIIDHNLGVKMTFTQDITNEKAEFIKEQMKSAMNAYNVIYNDEENSFTIEKRTKMLAISDSETNNQWYFLNLGDKSSEAIITALFDDKIRTEVGF